MPLRLRFSDRRLEQEYRIDRLAYRTLHLRISALVVCLIWASFMLMDGYFVPDQTAETLQVRIAGVALAGSLFMATCILPSARWVETASILFGFANIAMVFWLKLVIVPASDDLIRLSSLYMILTSASFVVGAPSFFLGVFYALTSWISFVLIALVLKPEPVPNFVYDFLFIMSVGLISGVAAFMLERAERLAWLQRGDLKRVELEMRALLHNVLPPVIADRKRRGEALIADHCPAVTVLFADIANFTQLSAHLDSRQIVGLLNDLFTRFDAIIARYGLEKIKTIGDCYMVAAGIPEHRPNHLRDLALVALEMLDATRSCRLPDGRGLDIRIGLHTGPAVAGVIGQTKFQFDVWGDTVNTASRLESHGRPGCIQVTDAVHEALQSEFRFDGPMVVDLKGKGPSRTWYLRGRSPSAAHDCSHTAAVRAE